MKKTLALMICMAICMTLGSVSARAADLVVYSSSPASLARALAKGYEARTGQHVDLYVSSTGKIMARLAAEAAHPHADVVILADWTAGLALAKQGDVEPYRPQAVVAQLVPQLDAPGPFLPIGADVVGIVANTALVPPAEAPEDWSGLTAARWKNKLTMPDPALSGTASDFVIAYIAHNGAKGWEWFKQLKANGCIWPGPNASALRPVEMGERSIMVAAVGHTAMKARLAGNSLEFLYPTGGVLLIPRPIIVMKSSAHKTQAEQFVDYAMSGQGQKDVSKSLLLPAVRGVKPSPVWTRFNMAHVLPVNWSTLATQRRAVLAEFRKITGGK